MYVDPPTKMTRSKEEDSQEASFRARLTERSVFSKELRIIVSNSNRVMRICKCKGTPFFSSINSSKMSASDSVDKRIFAFSAALRRRFQLKGFLLRSIACCCWKEALIL